MIPKAKIKWPCERGLQAAGAPPRLERGQQRAAPRRHARCTAYTPMPMCRSLSRAQFVCRVLSARRVPVGVDLNVCASSPLSVYPVLSRCLSRPDNTPQQRQRGNVEQGRAAKRPAGRCVFVVRHGGRKQRDRRHQQRLAGPRVAGAASGRWRRGLHRRPADPAAG